MRDYEKTDLIEKIGAICTKLNTLAKINDADVIQSPKPASTSFPKKRSFSSENIIQFPSLRLALTNQLG